MHRPLPTRNIVFVAVVILMYSDNFVGAFEVE